MQKTKKLIHARSKENGIVFYSNSFPLICSETFVDGSGQIQSRITTVISECLHSSIGIANENEITIKKWQVVAFDILLISFCILLKNIWFVLASIYFSLTISFDFYIFINISYQMKSKNGKFRSTARFHAAEHMVINAYEKLQRIPTFDEVKESSPFSKGCGSRFIIYRIINYSLVCIAMAFVADWNIYLYIVLLILISIFTNIANNKGWLRFLQVFITSKPSDKEILLAIEGIKNFEKMEEEINAKNSFIPCNFFPF